AWTPLKPPLPEPPQGFYNDLVSVMFTQDTWVIGVAGWGSFVLTSRDGGETWDLREAGQDYSRLWAAGEGKLLRMSFQEKKPSSAHTSGDLGATWQTQTTNLTAFPYMRALTWDGTQFLAAGEDGIIRASADGVTWEDRLPRGHRQDWTDLAFGDGRFVALANGDVAISADGLTWDLQPRPKPEPLYLRSIVRGPDRFVATGLGVYTSVDGVTWKQQVPADWPLSSVVWGSGRYVAIRHNETVASLDGTVWQVGPALGPERYLQGIVAGDTGFVAYGQSINGKDNEIYTSADGLTWTSQGLQPLIWSITYGKGLYVAFTISGNVITSPDGRIWTETKPPVREGVHVFFTGDQFVGMGTESVLLSADGRTWKVDGRQPARHGISNMAFGHGRLVAVGGAGSIIVATPVLAK
ncbi:MAG TPA: hypothetical protein VNT75_15765, partial [Symbiobacteriaceae bacterium]|nr:hypothetical protein [Symbiobacteriaceae bacterium]